MVGGVGEPRTGAALPAGRQGGEPITRSFVENRSELRYNTSQLENIGIEHRCYNTQMTEIDNKFSSFRERWNDRASTWDTEILKPEHYANFEEGYHKFLDFETDVLDAFPKALVGIDLGCGTGIAAEPLSKRVDKLFLLDIAEQMLEEAKKKYPDAIFLHESATAIPLDDNSIDVAISRGVLISHLPQGEYPNFLSEVHRILRPGGLFIIDFLNNLQTADFHLSSEKTVFTREGITEELKKFGFGDLVFDGQDTSRVLRVATVK